LTNAYPSGTVTFIENCIWSAGACSRFSSLGPHRFAFARGQLPKTHRLESIIYEMQLCKPFIFDIHAK
jgi:hypothetical protein